MLSRKKSFVITIGNYGAVVALHCDKEIKSKIFLEDLTEELKTDLKTLFTKNRSIEIAVMIDTIDQSYKKKSYPLIKKSDLEHIIKRDMLSDGDNESFKSFIINSSDEKPKVLKNSTTNSKVKSECLFVSVANSETITKWLDFLLDMPNRLSGIYMLPIESFDLFQLLKSDIKASSKAKSVAVDNVYFLFIQSKSSGFRQIVFSDHGIIFTRCVTYDLQEKEFLEKYEHDIYSTFEYLKRLLPDIRISEIDIVNILSNEALEKVKTIISPELNFVNYTPFQAASVAGYENILPENASYCDLLMSKVFANSKKILKFTNPRIRILDKFFFYSKFSYLLNIFLLLATFVLIIVVFIIADKNRDLLKKAELSKSAALKELSDIKLSSKEESAELTENGNPVDIERVIDFGKIDESLNSIGTDFTKVYSNLRFLKDEDIKLHLFLYSVPSFDYKNPEAYKKYLISFKGDLGNKSGDIDDLFKGFDSLTAKTKKNFPNDSVKYSDIPRNIDFAQKYYTFPVEFTLSK